MKRFNLVILEEAEHDIREAIAFENSRHPSLGQRLENVLTERFEALRSTPEMGSIRYGQVRCVAIAVFAYMLHYEVSQERKELVIARLYSTYRKPLWEEQQPGQ